MKAGDKITVKEKPTIDDMVMLRNRKADIPVHGMVYTVQRVTPKGSLVIEGLSHGNAKGWDPNNWERIGDHGISTHASRRLASYFEERDGCPETHPKELRYLPEEKVFDKDQEF